MVLKEAHGIDRAFVFVFYITNEKHYGRSQVNASDLIWVAGI